ncbi:MAG: YfhO family protein [Coprobacter sp.]|nr:YfhO family protein [Coprobacter sp.]
MKKALPYIGSVLFMILLSYVYFAPDIFEQRTLFQGDVQQGIAIGQEGVAFKELTGETTRWTNSIFSGMPNFQISPSYGNNAWISRISDVYRLWIKSPASLVFIMMLGFFILLITLHVKWPLALTGAIAYAFSSYFFIIIAAGHIWKFITLAYIPPTIAGILLAYRGKYLTGAALTAFFGMMQIVSNHIQMTYYFLFVIAAVVTAFLIDAIRQKQLSRFFKATGVLAIAGMLAVGANLPNLYHTYRYSKETMRGQAGLEQGAQNTEKSKAGLSTEYITQWSYGIGETWTLLIPDTKGGASGPIGYNPDSEAFENIPFNMKPYIVQMNRYWGDQPYTAGPVYAGALIMFFFVLGCLIVKGSMKWALLGATIFSVLLSWGHNLLPVTQWFIDYFPMYNKFRTVSSILVIAEFCIPLLAILALKEITENPETLSRKRHYAYIAFGLTGGMALLFALFPSVFFSFTSNQETELLRQNPEYNELFSYLIAVRQSIFTADAWRSVLFILAGCIFLWLYSIGKIGQTIWMAAIGILVLGDMYTINKRYLNSRHFVPERTIENPFPKTEADIAILADPDPHYRVYNLTKDPFNDAATSYYHKSVGGYHAAKLQRYDDLIKYQLIKNNLHVLNMLNTKYFIVDGEDRQTPQVIFNEEAAGNAWFISSVKWVDSPREEMNALTEFNEKTTAIANKSEQELFGKYTDSAAPGDTIYLTSYQPNELRYNANTKNGRSAVFSEIYFPWGWNITVDGQEVSMARVNYVLRGLDIPAGQHEIVFRFEPRSIAVTTGIAYASIIAILVLLAVAGIWQMRKSGNHRTNAA